MKNFVIFGVSGDLSQRHILPALSHLAKRGHKFNYFGYSRSPVRTTLQNAISKKFQFFTGNYDYTGLSALASCLTPDTIFYFSLPTSYDLIISLVSALLRYHLISSASQLIIEKPFGSDLSSAKKLMKYLDTSVGQDKIFLVDHYLTKELVRNLISLRFANPIISQLWNNQHISEINIIAIEKEGIGGRAQYYDQVGAVRDMVQNHCLQILALLTMPEPSSFNTADFVTQKMSVLRHLHLTTNSTKSIKIGQYHGYLQEVGVSPTSTTETYSQIHLRLDLPTWQSVPITITTGKKLPEKLTEINIVFKKDTHHHLWSDIHRSFPPNILSINLSPHSDIFLSLNSSFQSPNQFPKPQNLHLGSLSPQSSSAYENVILDIIDGVKINTPSFSEVLAQWRLTDRILSVPRLRSTLFYY
jgi:glucose-6-phosphate 1-dehydrogenase